MSYDETLAGIMKMVDQLGGMDPEAIRDGLEIRRLHRKIERTVEESLSFGGMNHTQMDLLEMLYFCSTGSLTPADLAEEVSVTRSAMTSVLDSLEKPGYIQRSPHPSDRRKIAISLTTKGRLFLDDALPHRYMLVQAITSRLQRPEVLRLLTIYQAAHEHVMDLVNEENS